MTEVHLVMNKGPEEGKIYKLDRDTIVLGRQASCGIVIGVTSVSREHAKIVNSAGQFYLFDNDSRNGTYLNGIKIDAKQSEIPLRNGDKIRICDVEFT